MEGKGSSPSTPHLAVWADPSFPWLAGAVLSAARVEGTDPRPFLTPTRAPAVTRGSRGLGSRPTRRSRERRSGRLLPTPSPAWADSREWYHRRGPRPLRRGCVSMPASLGPSPPSPMSRWPGPSVVARPRSCRRNRAGLTVEKGRLPLSSASPDQPRGVKKLVSPCLLP